MRSVWLVWVSWGLSFPLIARGEEGFVPLFNGKDLSGWKQQKGREKVAPDGSVWKVLDGAIVHVEEKGNGNSGHLHTEKSYRNYILHVDWKFNGKGTTGLYLGPVHLKIWDAAKTKPPASEGSGSIGYGPDRVKPLKKADKPLGEWNHFEIHVTKGTISVRLNGELIHDKVPRNFNKNGHTIGLQDHGTPVWFKNLRLKELPE